MHQDTAIKFWSHSKILCLCRLTAMWLFPEGIWHQTLRSLLAPSLIKSCPCLSHLWNHHRWRSFFMFAAAIVPLLVTKHHPWGHSMQMGHNLTSIIGAGAIPCNGLCGRLPQHRKDLQGIWALLYFYVATALAKSQLGFASHVWGCFSLSRRVIAFQDKKWLKLTSKPCVFISASIAIRLHCVHYARAVVAQYATCCQCDCPRFKWLSFFVIAASLSRQWSKSSTWWCQATRSGFAAVLWGEACT